MAEAPAPAPVGTAPPADPPEADSVAQPLDRSEPEAEPPPTEPDAAFGSTDFDADVDGVDLAELHALDEAPSHAHDIEQKIRSTFPGTEFEVLPDPEDEAEGET
ncbi:MAG: hypothetical protein F4144_04080 [Acidimicrobiaceae bacterium]|nr:hypothetical protein [Acidimicrobiaceae bacterium]